MSGPLRNNGKYDPFPYQFWSYPKTAKNPKEGRGDQAKNELAGRVIHPKKLCFVDRQSAKNPDGARTHDNPYGCLLRKDWTDKETPYMFISYTGMAFGRRCEGSKWNDECQCKSVSTCPTETLSHVLVIQFSLTFTMFRYVAEGCKLK